MAKTLLNGGNVLLLDEPSNDLDVETLRALEEALLSLRAAPWLFPHDRWFLDRIATHILSFEGDSRSNSLQATTPSMKQIRSAVLVRVPHRIALDSSLSKTNVEKE